MNENPHQTNRRTTGRVYVLTAGKAMPLDQYSVLSLVCPPCTTHLAKSAGYTVQVAGGARDIAWEHRRSLLFCSAAAGAVVYRAELSASCRVVASHLAWWLFGLRDCLIMPEPGKTVESLNEGTPKLRFCGRCSCHHLAELTAPKAGYWMDALVPDACPHCSALTWFTRYARHRWRRVYISERFYQSSRNKLEGARVNEKRKPAEHLVNEQFAAGWSIGTVFLMQHLGALENLQSIPEGLLPLRGTPWLPTDPAKPEGREEQSGSPPQTLEEAIEANDGNYPQLEAKNFPQTNAMCLGAPHVHDVALDDCADAPPGPSGPLACTVTAHYDSTCRAMGPQLVKSTVWKRRSRTNRQLGLNERSRAKESYKESSKAAQRLQKFYRRLTSEVFTKARILEAASHLPTNPSMLICKKISLALAEAYEDVISVEDSVEVREFLRKATVKFEVVAKPGKAPRLVIDEGFSRQLVNAMTCHIYEAIIFHVLYCISIKFRPKDEVADTIVGEFAVPGQVGIEVDQTGMELHERWDPKEKKGVMQGVITILRKIVDTLADGPDLFNGLLKLNLTDNNLAIVLSFSGEGYEAGYTVKFTDYYMTSGWLLTSAANFTNELGATLTAFTEDPWHLFAKDKQGRLRVESGTFDWMFRPLGADEKTRALFRPFVEGDDVLTRADAVYLGLAEEALAQYKDMGYSTKLKALRSGRLEFCGLHFAIKDGVSTGQWVPDIKRGFTKLSVFATTAQDFDMAAFTRYLSLSWMMRKACTPLAVMYFNVATELRERIMARGKNGLASELQLTYDNAGLESLYVARVQGEEETTLDALYDAVWIGLTEDAADAQQQAEMFYVSLESDYEDRGEFMHWMDNCVTYRSDMSVEEARAFLPPILR